MTAAELQLHFPFCRVVAPDLDYALPTRAWLGGPFWESFKADRWAKGVTTWERKNDCDNFARAMRLLLALALLALVSGCATAPRPLPPVEYAQP